MLTEEVQGEGLTFEEECLALSLVYATGRPTYSIFFCGMEPKLSLKKPGLSKCLFASIARVVLIHHLIENTIHFSFIFSIK